ncbi:MAG TPA: dienelactone hydrolase family protein [Blastocatellia bacterium]|nr:dienelactone hydrolase family protein [Blastocatellia bacterium]
MRLGDYDFDEFDFTHDGKTRKVFRRGTGPGIVIMHEIPGITPEVARFAGLVAEEGFTIFMPVMFGTPGKPKSAAYVLRELARVCVSKEFNCLAERESSPITEWLRALCREAFKQCGGPGVGAIGMCVTGGFALSLMVDEFVMAPVLSQPSLPLTNFSSERKAALGISDEELQIVKRRAQAGCKLLGLRFTSDTKCPPERFRTLERELGPTGFEGIEIDSSKGNPYHIKEDAHSVLTTELVLEDGHPTKKALDRVLELFRSRLLT